MTNPSANNLLEVLLEKLELPESAYEQAKSRYDDLGKWLCRDESSCNSNDPHVFPQGSFRLGTAIMPLNEKEPYDLDLACELSKHITKSSHTQQSVKKLIGDEVEAYRKARAIKADKEEKHRCWRLEYADSISFHMDIVPCVPEIKSKRLAMYEAMVKAGENADFATALSDLTVAITDNRHRDYNRISDDWEVSNPEGYAKWFESRMKLSEKFIRGREATLKAATIDEIPSYRWKSPLQLAVQLLKRHRDQMFEDNSDVKPISIIITTLAAKAYQGETDLVSALNTILTGIENLVNDDKPRIPNPVNPEEDFADRWERSECRDLNLERNFKLWVNQARRDFDTLLKSESLPSITNCLGKSFAFNIGIDTLSRKLGTSNYSTSASSPKEYNITQQTSPWRTEE